MAKSIDYYRELDYPISLKKGEHGWEAWHPDLGKYTMVGLGDSPDEAIEELNDLRIAVIERWLEDDQPVPEPRTGEEEFSGKFLVRIPKGLHHHLVEMARSEGSSLNQYIVHLLSRYQILDQLSKEFVPTYSERKAG
ncbi:hicB family protein [bacterium BMS3Bbin04]|nr:hicB family protein [bacterium BMS3Bbin04]